MPIPSNNYKPFLTYLKVQEYAKLKKFAAKIKTCLLYTSPSPRDV
jgi:hypothetical protein